MNEPQAEVSVDLCRCGHLLEDHHVSFLPGGAMLAEECEAEGSNETGGYAYRDGQWVEHCFHFEAVPIVLDGWG